MHASTSLTECGSCGEILARDVERGKLSNNDLIAGGVTGPVRVVETARVYTQTCQYDHELILLNKIRLLTMVQIIRLPTHTMNISIGA